MKPDPSPPPAAAEAEPVPLEVVGAPLATTAGAREACLSVLTGLAADWVWACDADLRVTSLSRGWQAFSGRDPASFLGQPAFPPDGRGFDAGCHEPFMDALARRQPFHRVEYRRPNHRGREHPDLWIQASGQPVRDGQGRFAGYVGIALDITARRQAQAVAERLQRLHNALGEVGEAGVSAADEPALYRAVCDALGRAGYVQVSIRRVDDDGRWLLPVAALGWPVASLSCYRLDRQAVGPDDAAAVPGELAPLSEPTARAFLGGQTQLTGDYQHDPALQASRARAAAQGIGSLVAVPLAAGGQIVGTLTVGSAQRHGFDAQDVALVERIAAALATALAHRDAAKRLAASEARYRRLNEIAADWIWECDAQLRLTYISPSFYERTGVQPAAVLGTRVGEFGFADAEHTPASAAYVAALADRRAFRDYEYARDDPDGHLRWRSLSGEPVFDAAGHFAGYQGTCRDITPRKRHEAELVRQAHHDTLTGLPNRALLIDRAERALARAGRGGQQVALMLLDLDQFKLVNDSHGHEVGDALLREAAARLAGCLREGDTVARLGGDEFVVLVDGVDKDAALVALAERLRHALRQPWTVQGLELSLEASIGVALYPRDGDSASVLLRSADAAMYAAKRDGGDRWQFYAASMNHRSSRLLTLRSALRRAIDAGEFELHYQSVHGVEDQRIVGAEALIRWRRHGRLVPPGEFLDVAEATGLIVPIGAWVLHEACRQARRWQDAGHPLPVSVNVSALQLRDGSLAQVVGEALAGASLDGALLTLEITESTLMAQLDEAAGTLRALQRSGVTAAIDDFGTGHSSLAYLKRLPAGTLKIDRSFLVGTPGDADNEAIVRAVIDLAHALDKNVVAEGVEHRGQLAMLAGLGCERAQGFGLGRPLAAEAFAARLAGQAQIRQSAGKQL